MKVEVNSTLGDTYRVDTIPDENGDWHTIASHLSLADARRLAKEINATSGTGIAPLPEEAQWQK